MLIVSVLVSACKKDPEPKGPEKSLYQKAGVFIVNEGPFSGTGSIDFLSTSDNQLYRHVFKTQNNGAVLGSIVQSLALFDDKAFVVVNNAGKVEVATLADFKSAGTITGLAQPRYMVKGDDNRAYVSQWGSDGLSGQVKVVNVSTLQVEDSVVLGGGPEQLLYTNGKLYVPNSGGFGSDSTVAVINTADNSIAEQLDVPGCPTEIHQSADGTIWVLSAGCFDANWQQGNGHITKIVGDQVMETYEFPHGPLSNLSESPDGAYLFMTGPDGIYRFEKTSGLFDTAPIVSGSFYGMDIDAQNRLLYASRANPNLDGKAFIYELDASNVPALKDSLTVGVYPGEFYFQY